MATITRRGQGWSVQVRRKGYRDKRLRKVKPGTIRREISLIHHALEIARTEWGYALPQNPVKDLALPRLNNARTRRLEKHEVPRLHAALQQTRNKLIGPVVQFALETALRRSEILNLCWEHVHNRHQQFVSRYEIGERRLDIVEFVDVAKALGLDASDLIKSL